MYYTAAMRRLNGWSHYQNQAQLVNTHFICCGVPLATAFTSNCIFEMRAPLCLALVPHLLRGEPGYETSLASILAHPLDLEVALATILLVKSFS